MTQAIVRGGFIGWYAEHVDATQAHKLYIRDGSIVQLGDRQIINRTVYREIKSPETDAAWGLVPEEFLFTPDPSMRAMDAIHSYLFPSNRDLVAMEDWMLVNVYFAILEIIKETTHQSRHVWDVVTDPNLTNAMIDEADAKAKKLEKLIKSYENSLDVVDAELQLREIDPYDDLRKAKIDDSTDSEINTAN